MDQGPLVVEETDAGAELVRRFDRYNPVKAAFWVKGSDEGRWYLYIASDQFDERNLDVAYGEILRLADQMASPYLDPFEVKLIAGSDPLAKAVSDIHERYPGTSAIRFGGKNLGGMSVEGAYIYPSSVSTLNP